MLETCILELYEKICRADPMSFKVRDGKDIGALERINGRVGKNKVELSPVIDVLHVQLGTRDSKSSLCTQYSEEPWLYGRRLAFSLG